MTNILKILFLVFISLFHINEGFAQQKYRLAVEYYNSGEYEKAAQIYESLYKENPKNKSYFSWYIQCLIDLRSYEKATQIIQNEIKSAPSDVSLFVAYGNLLERQGQHEKAKTEYRKAIDKL
ncbi:MAG: tetratricopeptide repeat protein, partial [Saprospiraceae bacterium]